MFASIARAARLIFQPGYAGITLRSALLTLVLFLVGLAGTELLIANLPVLGNPQVNRALELLAPVLFVFLLSALGAPVAALFGTFFSISWPGGSRPGIIPARPRCPHIFGPRSGPGCA
jgi:hypothetical protein